MDVFKSFAATGCLYGRIFNNYENGNRQILFVFVCCAGTVAVFQYLPECWDDGYFFRAGHGEKIYFPREVLPIAFTISQFVNMLLSFLVIFAVLIISGIRLNPQALFFLPLVMLVEFVMALGVTYLVSALNVYFRDLEHILGILSMAWMYLTPILYPMDMVPQQYVGLFTLNPMTSITVAYRDILYYGQVPHMNTLFHALAMGVLVLAIGQVVFGRLQRHFVEEL